MQQGVVGRADTKGGEESHPERIRDMEKSEHKTFATYQIPKQATTAESFNA